MYSTAFRLPNTLEGVLFRSYGYVCGHWRGRQHRPVLIVGNSFTAAWTRWVQKTGHTSEVMDAHEWVKRSHKKRYQLLEKYSHVIFTCLKYNRHFFREALIRGCIPIALFIGSDVVKTGQDKKRLRVVRRAGRLGIILAVSSGLVDELRQLGIAAHYFPFIAQPVIARTVALPHTFTVLSYIQEKKELLYGYSYIYRLARDFPDIKFIVIGHSGNGLEASKNIVFSGYVTRVKKYIDDCSVYVRMTQHDGMPNMVVEALACGRQVIWSQAHKHCCTCVTYDSLRTQINMLRNNQQSNIAGMEYVAERYAEHTLVAAYHALLG